MTHTLNSHHIVTEKNKLFAIVLSSHILSEVEQTADHIGILAGGRLGYQGGMPPQGHLEEMFMKIVAKSRKGGEL